MCRWSIPCAYGWYPATPGAKNRDVPGRSVASPDRREAGAVPGWSGVVWVSCPAFPGSYEMPLPGNILNPGLSGTLLVSTYVHRGDAAIVRGSAVVGPAYSGVCWVSMCSPTELWQYPGIVQARPGRVPV